MLKEPRCNNCKALQTGNDLRRGICWKCEDSLESLLNPDIQPPSTTPMMINLPNSDIFKVAGTVLMYLGLVDLIASFFGTEIWWDWFSVPLPGILSHFTAYVEIGLGVFLRKQGMDNN